tara:strand:- start:6002 stop:7066 length:1065 start_codon:yes stop_codon:yes gene_type:complete
MSEENNQLGTLILEPEDFGLLEGSRITDLVAPVEGNETAPVTNTLNALNKTSLEINKEALKVFANQLKEKGLLTYEEGESLEDPDLLLEKFETALNSKSLEKFEDFKRTAFSEKDQVYLNLRKEGFAEDLAKDYSEKLNFYNNISEESLEDERILERIHIDYLQATTEFSDEEIAEELATLKDLDKLSGKVRANLPKLISRYGEELTEIKEEIRTDKESQLKVVNQFATSLKDNVSKLQTIGELQISKQLRDKVIESISIPVGKDKFGNPISKVQATKAKNPVAFETMIHAYVAAGLFDIDDKGNPNPKFDLFKNISKSSAVKELSDVFKKERTDVGTTTLDNNSFINQLRGLT